MSETSRSLSVRMHVLEQHLTYVLKPYAQSIILNLLLDVGPLLGLDKSVFDVCSKFSFESQKQKEFQNFKTKIKINPEKLEEVVVHYISAWVLHLLCSKVIKPSPDVDVKKLSISSLFSMLTTSIHAWFCYNIGHMKSITQLKVDKADYDQIFGDFFQKILETSQCLENIEEYKQEEEEPINYSSDESFRNNVFDQDEEEDEEDEDEEDEEGENEEGGDDVEDSSNDESENLLSDKNNTSGSATVSVSD
jgi:hypothetical protein